MTDDLIFREVDEDVRRDRMEALWRKYAPHVIGGAVLIVVAVTAIVLWREHQRDARLERGGQFEQALELVAAGKPADAAEIFEQLAAEGDAGYGALASQQAAAARLAAGDERAALAAFERLASNADTPELERDIATIKAALLALKLDGGDAALDRIARVADGAGPFRNIAREIRAGALLARGDREGARTELNALSEDSGTTANQKRRVVEYLRALEG